MSYLLSMGRPAAQVALYLPSSSMRLGDQAGDTAFVATEQLLSEHQVDFDIVSEDAIAQDLKPVQGGLQTASGNVYKTLVLPGEELLSQSALDRLRAFAQAGGHVLFLGKTPSLIAGRTILNARPATPADFAWASLETSAQLPPTPTPPAQPPVAPPSPQVVPAAILNAVLKSLGPLDVSLDAPDPALKVMKRRLRDSDVYLFFNEGPAASNHTVTFRNDGQLVERWDPETGKIAAVVSSRSEGAFNVQLQLAPYQTAILMIR
jgi:hypothetical protein